MWHSTKRCSSIFDLGPLTPKIYSRNLYKIAYKSACMADRPEMFVLTRGFSGMADSMEPCKMLWADPCCHGNEVWARRGDPDAFRLVCLRVSVCHTLVVLHEQDCICPLPQDSSFPTSSTPISKGFLLSDSMKCQFGWTTW